MKDKNKNLAVGAAIGAVAGVIAGVLFAPKSGKETREDLKHMSSKTVEAFVKEAKKLEVQIEDLIKESNKTRADVAKSVADTMKKYQDQAYFAQEKLVTLYKAVKNDEVEDICRAPA